MTGLLPPTSAAAAGRPLMGFATDADSRAAILQAGKDLGFADVEAAEGGVEEAVRVLAVMPTPKRLVVDLSGRPDPFSDLSSLADACDQGTRLIALGTTNDITFYRRLLDHGVDEYLLKPVDPSALVDALRRLERQTAAAVDTGDGEGRLVCVVGARGGVGSTTVAVNTAWLCAHELGLRTALVDLDLYFGTCALALDLEPGRGFREALENPERIDGLFMERAMVRESEKLFVLAAEDDIENAHAFDSTALSLLIDHLRRDLDCIVLDLPRFAARTQLALLTPPLSVVLVSDPSIAGMRDTLRLAKALRKSAAAADVAVTLNRCGAIKGGELGKADFERDAGVKVSHVVPFDAKPAAASAGAGKPLVKVAPRSKAAASLRRLAWQVAGDGGRTKTAAGRGGGIKTLLKLGGGRGPRQAGAGDAAASPDAA